MPEIARKPTLTLEVLARPVSTFIDNCVEAFHQAQNFCALVQLRQRSEEKYA